MLLWRCQGRWKTFPRIAVWCRTLCELKGPAFLPFSIGQPCKGSLCSYFVHVGALPLQERGWSERAFLTQHIGLEMSAGTTAAPVGCLEFFWLLQKGGSSQAAYARSCCSALPLHGPAGRGDSPAQHVSHAGKEVGKLESQGLHSAKRRGNITFPLSTTTQGRGGSPFPLLAKLVEKRIRTTEASRLASLQLIPMPGSAGLGVCRTPAPETTAGRRDGACLPNS